MFVVILDTAEDVEYSLGTIPRSCKIPIASTTLFWDFLFVWIGFSLEPVVDWLLSAGAKALRPSSPPFKFNRCACPALIFCWGLGIFKSAAIIFWYWCNSEPLSL